MGLSTSALDRERLTELVDEVLGTFSRAFPAALREVIVASEKEHSMLLCRKGWELSSAPMPAHYLKRGFLTKQGHSVKSWKKRLFTALNAADNFVVVYFVDEREPKERGRIECFGCRVEGFSPEETASFGPYGFKIMPYLDTNRSWLIVAGSEEERSEWQTVFANACRKASPRVHEDPVVAKAFLIALERTRKAYQFYGRAELVGTEVESLCSFVIQVLLREILDDAFSAVKPSQRASYIKSVREVVEGMVREAVVETWGRCVHEAMATQTALRSSISYNMSIVLDTEERLTKLLKTEMDPIMSPVVSDMLSDTVMPFIEAIYPHVVGVHSAAASGFWEAMRSWIMRYTSTTDTKEWCWVPVEKHVPASELVARSASRFDAREDSTWGKQYQRYGVKEKDPRRKSTGGSPGFGNTAYMRNKSFTAADAQPLGTPLRKAASMCYDVDADESPALGRTDRTPSEQSEEAAKSKLLKRIINELFKCHVGVDDTSNGLLRHCSTMLWDLYTTDLESINEGSLSDSLSAYDVYTYWLDSLQVLLHNAIYTFELMANSLSDEDLTPDFLLGLVDDVTRKLLIDSHKSVFEGLNSLSHDLIRCTCQEVLEGPCLDIGPSLEFKIPTVVSDAINMENMIEETVEARVREALSQTIEVFVADQKRKIESPF